MAPCVQRGFKMQIPSADVASRQDPTRPSPQLGTRAIAKSAIRQHLPIAARRPEVSSHRAESPMFCCA